MIKTGSARPMCTPLRWLAAAPGSLVLAGTLAAAAPPSAGPAVAPVAVTNYPGQLNGVAAVSASDAWAVGLGRAMALHWNGTGWTPVPVPHPGTLGNILNAVAAVGASDVWAVGASYDTRTAKTLIVHWNGTRWARVPSPSFGAGSQYGSVLTGVSATSASDVWAVGYYSEPNPAATLQNLILHWDGTRWARVPSPEPATQSTLNAVTSLSATDAWAAGFSANLTTGVIQGLMLHWDGTNWTSVAVPSPSSDTALNGVSADSPARAWAVGSYSAKTWALHWNGTAWSTVPSPSPGGSTANAALMGVIAVSPGDAWAVGSYATSYDKTLIVHWNGTRWARVPSPNPGGSNGNRLFAVSAVSASDAWAAGSYDGNTSSRTLILHWNGTAWSRA